MQFRKPDTIPLLFIIAAVLVFSSLGVWQLERLQWKEKIFAQIKQAQSEPALGTLPQDLSGIEYHNVQLTGKFLYDKTLRRAGGMQDEPPGFFLITPFVLEDDGRTILVNRGFSPQGKDAKPEGTQTLSGVIRPIRDKSFLAFFIENYPQENIWSYEDVPAMSKATGLSLTPVMVEAVGKQQHGVYPMPSNGTIYPSNDHLQYAITWFSLAISAVVMFVFYQRKPK